MQSIIEQSFIFLDRISKQTEQKLWQKGISDWDHFKAESKIIGMSKSRKRYYERQLEKIKTAVQDKDLHYLSTILPKNEHWRLYPLFKDQVLYIDIETAHRYGDITVLGAHNGKQYFPFIKGRNLNKDAVQRLFDQYKIFITFNGSSFDIPIIERYFGGVLPKGHLQIDLRHLLSKLGFFGGLKTIEIVLGINRQEELQGMVGADAVLLWQQYLLTQDEELLDRILDYNEADCKNLQPLTNYAIQRLWQRIRD